MGREIINIHTALMIKENLKVGIKLVIHQAQTTEDIVVLIMGIMTL